MIVRGRVVRPVGLDTFADITNAPLLTIGREALEFDGDLTPGQVEAIWWRMTSRDDADQARRESLAAQCAALDPEDPVQATVCAAIRYMLGMD